MFSKLSSRSYRVVILNVQSSEDSEINPSVSQGPVFGPPGFPLSINNLPKKLLRSLANIYANDTVDYESTTKNLDCFNLEANLSSDFARTDLWGRDWPVT